MSMKYQNLNNWNWVVALYDLELSLEDLELAPDELTGAIELAIESLLKSAIIKQEFNN